MPITRQPNREHISEDRVTNTGRLHTTLGTGAFVSNLRYLNFARRSLWLALALHSVLFAVFLVLRLWGMALLEVLCVGVYLFAQRSVAQRRIQSVQTAVLITEQVHGLIACAMVGTTSGFHVYVWLLIPMVMVEVNPVRWQRFIKIAAILLSSFLLPWSMLNVTPVISLPRDTLHMLWDFNIAMYLGLTALFAHIYADTVASHERRLHRHASTDALTGLRNRRRMVSMALESMSQSRRHDSPLSVILCDIDRFKAINDQFGHGVGDIVLVDIAGCLQDVVAESNLVARWGGEEFLLLLPGNDLQAASQIAENLRQQLHARHVELPNQTVYYTASFGVAEWLRGNETFDAWLARADQALYDAKQAGRDRVCVSDNTPLQETAVASLLADGKHPLTQHPAFHNTITTHAQKTQALTLPSRTGTTR